MDRKRVAVRVGQTMNLTHDGFRNIPLHSHASHDNPVLFYLDQHHTKVKVLKISFHRRDLRKPNALWLYVESVKDPNQKGWVAFDCGGWDEGDRIMVDRVVFEKRESPKKEG